MFYGVLGQPYFDLAPFLDLSGMDEMVDEVTAYLRSTPPMQHVPFTDEQDIHRNNRDATHLGYAVRLVGIRGIAAETLEDARRAYLEPAATHLPKTMAFLCSLPLRGLGRASIYHHPHVPIHRDYADHPGLNNSFIYLNPMAKPFFIIGPDGERHMVETPASIFNPSDYHGMDHCDRFTFTLRVNGWFNDDLIARTGLADHFNNAGQRRQWLNRTV